MSATTLPWRHALLALAVAAVWGTNFVVIKVALEHFPPLLMAALRFALVVLPAVFLIRRPAVPWGQLAAYGLLIGAGQFGLLYIAMRADISPGLASLVVQIQVFFTIGFAAVISGERVRGFQYAALLVALAGFAVIALNSGGDVTPLGLGLVILAALSWAGGNIVARRSQGVNMLAYVVWSSLFAVPPLLALSLLIEGPAAIAAGFAGADLESWAAVVWQSVGNTMFGYAVWGWLLSRYPAATVTRAALLVPVFGMASSAALLDEPVPAWKIIAALLVLSGLALNLLWPRLRRPATV